MSSGTVTVQLNEETIRLAKQLAAERGISVGDLVAEQIRALVRRARDYELAKDRAVATMHKGFDLGGGPYYADRGELHERS